MKLSEETKELILPIVGCVLIVLFTCAFLFGLIHVIGIFILDALRIIFNRN